MEQKKMFTALNDDALDQVTGGYLEVSKWRNYVAETVAPAIFALSSAASDNDKTIINTVYGVFQGTAIPGAAISSTIQNLWNDFTLTYRDRLESQDVKTKLGQIISDAKDYLKQHA